MKYLLFISNDEMLTREYYNVSKIAVPQRYQDIFQSLWVSVGSFMYSQQFV